MVGRDLPGFRSWDSDMIGTTNPGRIPVYYYLSVPTKNQFDKGFVSFHFFLLGLFSFSSVLPVSLICMGY